MNSDFKKSGKGGGGGLNSLVSLTKDFPFFMTYLWGASRFCWLMLGKGQTKITFLGPYFSQGWKRRKLSR